MAAVTRWCQYYGLNELLTVQPRPRRGDTVELDAATLRAWYVDERRTIDQIAAGVGVDSAIVALAIHGFRIPMRPPGPADRAAVCLLDALYADSTIVDTLRRHGTPIRRQAGTLQQLFPNPAPLRSDLAGELYTKVGLSTTHIAPHRTLAQH